MPQDAAVAQEAGAHTGSEGDPDNGAVSTRRPGPPFTEHESVRVVAEADAGGVGQRRRQSGSEIEATQRVELAYPFVPSDAAFVVEGAGQCDSPPGCALRGQASGAPDEGRQDLFGTAVAVQWLTERSAGPEAAGLDVHTRRGHVCAADVHHRYDGPVARVHRTSALT